MEREQNAIRWPFSGGLGSRGHRGFERVQKALREARNRLVKSDDERLDRDDQGVDFEGNIRRRGDALIRWLEARRHQSIPTAI